MEWTTLIDVETLARRLADPAWVIVDCRFSLADTAAGRRQYLAAHVPGAVYAHLDEMLSNPPATDRGRHPLPAPAVLTQRFGALGIDGTKQVVAYDDASGAIAARLWWMLRYMGHAAVAVLDGGWPAWQAAGHPTAAGDETNPPALFTGAPRRDWLVTMPEVAAQALLVDSRDGARYRGEMEPIDAQAGHIPGAINYFFQENWGEDGRYLPPDVLRARLQAVLGDTPAEEAVFYCGSGVTACVNLLALAHAGLGNGRLYAGSWSEWSREPENPIAQAGDAAA
ncbi:MAG: sulfurtransferase [Anaerolineales bacterium]|nr:sulfurtransferase [Anaerolineales bacterium]